MDKLNSTLPPDLARTEFLEGNTARSLSTLYDILQNSLADKTMTDALKRMAIMIAQPCS